jgi:hypothetical protein
MAGWFRYAPYEDSQGRYWCAFLHEGDPDYPDFWLGPEDFRAWTPELGWTHDAVVEGVAVFRSAEYLDEGLEHLNLR